MGKDIELLLECNPKVVREKLLPLLADICGMWSYANVCERMTQYNSANTKQRKELAETLICLSDNWQRCKPVEDVPEWNGYTEADNRYWNEPREAYFEYQDERERAKAQKEWESKLPLSNIQVEWLQRWAAEPQPVEEAPTNVICCKDHFLMRWADEDLKDLFEMLKGRRYIAQETTFEQWRYVCTGRGGNEPHEPVMWIKSQSELECLISHIKDDTGEQGYWKKAGGAFLLSDTGRHPNPDSMKNHFMKVRIEQPKNWQGIDAIFLECS